MSSFCVHARPHLPGQPAGLLSGLSFAVKDVFAIRGVTSCYGNPTWLETHAPAQSNARAVDQLLHAGASLVGLTITDELALSLTGENAHYGAPDNPRAPERVAGGSSAGSAAVVARGDVDFALGTDTGGSVRVPASHTGVYGYRPTHGAVASEGVLPLAPRFDCVGVFARTPALLERVAGVLLPDASPSEPRRLLGLAELERWVDAEAWSAFELGAPRLANALGVPFEWLSQAPLPRADSWLACYLTLQNLQAGALHRSWIEQARPDFGSLIARRIGWMLDTKPSAAGGAEACREQVAAGLAQLFADGSWLVLPSAPGAAPRRGLSDDAIEAYTARALTLAAPASLAGLPQLSLPIASAEQCPLGISLVGPRASDRALLRVALRAPSPFESNPGASR